MRLVSFASLLALPAFGLLSVALGSLPLACSSSSGTTPPPGDGGNHDSPSGDAPHDAPSKDHVVPNDGSTSAGSAIQHLVVIVQENHSFDNYFGRYCTAATGSMPTCNTGPSCCEKGPDTDPGTGDAPSVQDDKANGSWDPNHLQACELQEINKGKMDGYVTNAMGCGDPRNFAYADATSAKTYWDLAKSGALADNYFQSVVGASSSNDMYLAHAAFVFLDNSYEPPALGSSAGPATCQFGNTMSFTGATIADLMVGAGVSWAWFGQGYDDMVAAQKMMMCPTDSMCPGGAHTTIYPCTYDPGDDPFLYYAKYTDNPKYILDYTELASDIASYKLPAVSYVKAIGYRTEHPGLGDTMSAGQAFVSEVLSAVSGSPYASDTLVLVTWDESGGFFDHVAPPADSTIDSQPYGPRIPLLAAGKFAKKNYISHVQMEHASIVKFIEWNWLKQKTGQLGQRDTVVNNIGDMLDPAQTGVTVPSN